MIDTGDVFIAMMEGLPAGIVNVGGKDFQGRITIPNTCGEFMSILSHLLKDGSHKRRQLWKSASTDRVDMVSNRVITCENG